MAPFLPCLFTSLQRIFQTDIFGPSEAVSLFLFQSYFEAATALAVVSFKRTGTSAETTDRCYLPIQTVYYTMKLLWIFLALLPFGSNAFKVSLRTAEVAKRIKAFASAVEEETESGDIDADTGPEMIVALRRLAERLDNMGMRSDRPRRSPFVVIGPLILWIRHLIDGIEAERARDDREQSWRRGPYIPPWRPLPGTATAEPPLPQPQHQQQQQQDAIAQVN